MSYTWTLETISSTGQRYLGCPGTVQHVLSAVYVRCRLQNKPQGTCCHATAGPFLCSSNSPSCKAFSVFQLRLQISKCVLSTRRRLLCFLVSLQLSATTKSIQLLRAVQARCSRSYGKRAERRAQKQLWRMQMQLQATTIRLHQKRRVTQLRSHLLVSMSGQTILPRTHVKTILRWWQLGAILPHGLLPGNLKDPYRRCSMSGALLTGRGCWRLVFSLPPPIQRLPSTSWWASTMRARSCACLVFRHFLVLRGLPFRLGTTSCSSAPFLTDLSEPHLKLSRQA